jgi:hypothetical protein
VACDHARHAAVMHRREVEEHDWPEDREAECCCAPAVVCLLCDARAIRLAATLGAAGELVEQLRSRDVAQRPKLLN